MSTLSLASLQQQGAYTGAPVPKEISWEGPDGTEHTATVYVRRLSYLAAVNDVRAHQGKIDVYAGRIAACICDEHGKAIFRPEDVTGYHEDGSPVMIRDPESGEEVPQGQLCSALSLELLGVIGEVNPAPGKTKS